MAQISSNWTAPTFSFDAADQPNAWIDFYYRAQGLPRSTKNKTSRGRQGKKGMGTNHTDVYRGKQTDTSAPHRQQQNYRNRPTNTNTSPKSP